MGFSMEYNASPKRIKELLNLSLKEEEYLGGFRVWVDLWTDYNKNSVQVSSSGSGPRCTCGAKHTSNPYHHSFWCDLA